MDFMQTMAQAAGTFVMTAGIRLVWAVVLLVVGMKLIKWITAKVGKLQAIDKLDTNLRGFLESGVRFGLYALLVIILCNVVGINTASLITVLASCGVAVGLAMQGALSNVAGGLMLLVLHPFHVGDYVDVAGVSGTVSRIDVFSTTICTVDNRTAIVPNGSITGSTIVNYSTNGNRRVDLSFNIGFDTPVETAKEAMLEIAKANSKVLSDPAPFVRVLNQGDKALAYTVRVWCKTADYWDVYFDMTEAITAAFQQKDISIPVPKMDVRVNS